MKLLACLLLILSALQPAHAGAAKRIQDLAMVYGFVVGQDHSLQRIEQEFPTLVREVALARYKFNSTFPGAEAKLAERLREAMGNEFNAFDRKLRDKLSGTQQPLSFDAASEFVAEVRSRAERNIPPEILKPLLIGLYPDSAREFADQFRQSFQTDGSGKAQGLRLAIELPASFASREGKRPNILRQWISQDGTGPVYVNIGVREIGHVMTQADVDAEYDGAFMQELAGAKNRLLGHGKFTHEGYPAVWVASIRTEERASFQVIMPTHLSQIYVGSKAITLMCASALTDNAKDPVEVFEGLRPLCLQVLNSLIILNRYRG